jgi:hypothetical protein
MPAVEQYARDMGNGATNAQSASLSLLEHIAHARPSTSGLALFMAKTTILSASLATVGGVTATVVCAPLLGPVVPFLVGSWVGFTAGVAQRWVFDSQEACDAIQRYPQLMEHHVRHVKSDALEGLTWDEWRADLPANRYKQSLAILALYGAAESLTAVRKQQEEDIVARIRAANSAKLA